MSPFLTGDPELTGLPGIRSAVGIHGSGRGPVLVLGCWGLACKVAGIVGVQGITTAYKKPEVLGVLACGTASARPFRVTQGGALD